MSHDPCLAIIPLSLSVSYYVSPIRKHCALFRARYLILCLPRDLVILVVTQQGSANVAARPVHSFHSTTKKAGQCRDLGFIDAAENSRRVASLGDSNLLLILEARASEDWDIKAAPRSCRPVDRKLSWLNPFPEVSRKPPACEGVSSQGGCLEGCSVRQGEVFHDFRSREHVCLCRRVRVSIRVRRSLRV